MPFDLPPFSIPLWALLVAYGAYLAFFLLYAAFNLYHLLRFGMYGLGLYLITALFVVGTVLLIAASYSLLAPFDWTVSFPVSSLFDRSATSTFFQGIP